MAMQASVAVRDAHDDDIIALAYDSTRRVVYCTAQATDIRAWDLKTGLCSVLKAHRGPVMALVFCEGLSLLVSGGLDGYCILWDDRNCILQIVNMEVPVHSMCWSSHHSVFAVGLHSSVFLFSVSLPELVALRRHRHRQVNLDGAARLTPISLNDRKRRGPQQDTSDQVPLFKQLGPEMHGPGSGHMDVVSGICITESGLVFTVSHDHTFCMWDLDRPADTFSRSARVHSAAIVSLTHDVVNNWFVTGAFDGSFQVWSSQGKLMEAFRGVTDDRTKVVYVPMTHMYWQLGRYGHIHAYDPRAPANITPFVEESNSLADHNIANVWVQPYTDCVFGATHDRDIIMWKYNLFGAHRTFKGHHGWAEALLVVQLPLTDEQRQVQSRKPESARNGAAAEERKNEHIFTADATGCILKWTLNREQLCELFEIEATIKIGSKNILAIAYCPELNSIIAGGEEEFIKVYSLDRKQRLQGDMPLPDTLYGHTARVTGLTLLKDFVLVSVSYDRTICFWDLHTMKEIERGRKLEAHQAPIVGLHYVPERDELATWALENVAKVWNVSKPHNATVLFQLDAPGEVSQVRWVPWKQRWLTTSDDDCARLWAADGTMTYMFGYDGGCVNALYADTKHKLVLLASQDVCMRVFDLEDPVPKAKYYGHSELIRGIGFIEELNCYATCSWDKTMRVWQGYHKSEALAKHHRRVLTHRDLTGGGDEKVTSQYEKSHPLVMPRSLLAPKVVDLGMSLRKNRHKKKKFILSARAEQLSKQLDKLDKELLDELQPQPEDVSKPASMKGAKKPPVLSVMLPPERAL